VIEYPINLRNRQLSSYLFMMSYCIPHETIKSLVYIILSAKRIVCNTERVVIVGYKEIKAFQVILQDRDR
jgi:hypothetical protein